MKKRNNGVIFGKNRDMFQLEEMTTEMMHNEIQRSIKLTNYHIVCCAWIGYTLAGMIAERIGITAEYRDFLGHAADSANHRKNATTLFPLAKLSLLPIDTTIWKKINPNWQEGTISLNNEEIRKSVKAIFELNEQKIHSENIYFYLETAFCNYELVKNILIELQRDNDFQSQHPTVKNAYLSCLNI